MDGFPFSRWPYSDLFPSKAAATQLDNQLFTMEFNGQLSQAGESWENRRKIEVNDRESSWIIMVNHEKSNFRRRSKILWRLRYCLPWLTMLCHHLPWFTMIYHDLPWFTMTSSIMIYRTRTFDLAQLVCRSCFIPWWWTEPCCCWADLTRRDQGAIDGWNMIIWWNDQKGRKQKQLTYLIYVHHIFRPEICCAASLLNVFGESCF